MLCAMCVSRRCGPPTRWVKPMEPNQRRHGRTWYGYIEHIKHRFDLMRSVAGTTDTRNEEIRAMMQAFIGRMSSVPPSVWGGLAAGRFKDVVDRWNTESMRLYHVLHDIAETIRHNEAALQEAGQTHAHHIAAAGENL